MAIKDCSHESWMDSGICLICSPPDGWQHHSECLKHDPDMWFPEEEELHLYDQARRICEECPVVSFCLEIGISERHGMWGGLEPNERYKLSKSNKLPKDRLERRRFLRIHAWL